MIRPATVADAEAIGAVQRRSWVHAYADILDVEDLSPAIGVEFGPQRGTNRPKLSGTARLASLR